jgi:hypothetical protein
MDLDHITCLLDDMYVLELLGLLSRISPVSLGQIITRNISSALTISLTSSLTDSSRPLPITPSLSYDFRSSDSFLEARPCLSTWISYWKDRMHTQVRDDFEYESWRTMGSSSFRQWSETKYKETCLSSTFVVTSTSTITEPASTECDGKPRARSIGESTIVFTTTVARNSACPEQYDISQPLLNQGYESDKDAPKCQVPIPECSESWDRFTAIFTDWNCFNTTFPHLDWQKISKRQEAYPCNNPLCHYIAHMGKWNDHLFINCTEVLPYLRLHQALHEEGESRLLDPDYPQLQKLGITNKLSPQELDKRLDEVEGCSVFVDQFVLLYFEPDIPKTRNICTSSGYGEFFSYSYTQKSSPGLLQSAVVPVITFNAHDLRQDVKSKQLFYYI